MFSVYDGIAIMTSAKIRERLIEAGFINETHPFSNYYMDMSERWYSASEYLNQMSFDEKMKQDIESLNLTLLCSSFSCFIISSFDILAMVLAGFTSLR